MKTYNVHKDIRKGALIGGLTLLMFAVMMIAVIISLLVIIFSFSLILVLIVVVANTALYVGLLSFQKNPIMISLGSPYPKIISNKRTNHLDYEED